MKAKGFQGGLFRLARLGLRQHLYDDPEVQVRLAVLEQFRDMNQRYGIPVREAADLESVRRQWAQWEDIYNRVRPHESLDLKTPIEYITQQSSSRTCSHIS